MTKLTASASRSHDWTDWVNSLRELKEKVHVNENKNECLFPGVKNFLGLLELQPGKGDLGRCPQPPCLPSLTTPSASTPFRSLSSPPEGTPFSTADSMERMAIEDDTVSVLHWPCPLSWRSARPLRWPPQSLPFLVCLASGSPWGCRVPQCWDDRSHDELFSGVAGPGRWNPVMDLDLRGQWANRKISPAP